MKLSLLINMKMPTILAFSYLLAEKFSCSAMFSKKEFGIGSYLRFVSMKISCSAELSMKNFYNLRAGVFVFRTWRKRPFS